MTNHMILYLTSFETVCGGHLFMCTLMEIPASLVNTLRENCIQLASLH